MPIVGDDRSPRSPLEVEIGLGGESFLSAVYLLFAAGIGVLFSSSTGSTVRISRGQYDPAEDAVHITTVVFGLIAGVVAAMFLSDMLKDTDGSQRFSQPLPRCWAASPHPRSTTSFPDPWTP